MQTSGRTSGSDFSELYRAAAPAVFAWLSVHVRGALRREVDPEDLLQEVAMRAYEAMGRFDPERSSFKNWLFGIARNVLMKVLERMGSGASKGREPLSTSGLQRIPEDATSVTRAVARDEGLKVFLGKLDEMEEGDRRLIVHRGLEGLPFAEVGELLGEAEGTVQKRWERLRERLRESGALLDLLVG